MRNNIPLRSWWSSDLISSTTKPEFCSATLVVKMEIEPKGYSQNLVSFDPEWEDGVNLWHLIIFGVPGIGGNIREVGTVGWTRMEVMNSITSYH